MSLLGDIVSLTLFTLVIFEKLHALEGSRASNKLVRELGLVRLVIATVFLIDLFVCVCRLACGLSEAFSDEDQLSQGSTDPSRRP